MKAIAFALFLGWGGMAFAQEPAPSLPNNELPDPGKLFHSPLAPGSARPQFRLQIPDGAHPLLSLPGPLLVPPRQPRALSAVDPGIRHQPQGFVQRPSRPAQPSRIYPDLKILPIEMARLESGPQGWPDAKLQPIPTTWPNGKIEPIPITWQGYRMVPLAAHTATEARK